MSLRWSMLLGLFAGGCVFDPAGLDSSERDARPAIDAPPPGIDTALPVDASPAPDSGIDAAACEGWTFPPTNFDPCDPAIPPPGMIDFSPPGIYRYDTGTGTLFLPGGLATVPASALVAQPSGPMARVLPLVSLTIPAATTLQIVGANPLIIAVWTGVTSSGVIDASAILEFDGSSTPGPGAGDAVCSAAQTGDDGDPSTGIASGGGGGGGGGFGDDGADGGDGHGGGNGAHGAKGAPGGSVDLSPIRGGCNGGLGGNSDLNPTSAGVGGQRGAGGGAIQISAQGMMIVNGPIRSLGAGGGGGQPGPFSFDVGRAGGGGGGSGGAIFLEADNVQISAAAFLCANGGSGGEGTGISGLGSDGSAGSCSETTPATTFNVSIDGGNGGNGGYRGDTAPPNAPNGANGGGGGGGGGGVGRIRIIGVTSLFLDPTSTESPEATM